MYNWSVHFALSRWCLYSFGSVMLLARTSRCSAGGGGRSHLWRAEQVGDVQFQPGRRQPQRTGVEDARLNDVAAAGTTRVTVTVHFSIRKDDRGAQCRLNKVHCHRNTRPASRLAFTFAQKSSPSGSTPSSSAKTAAGSLPAFAQRISRRPRSSSAGQWRIALAA
jgi:hypothetical protein